VEDIHASTNYISGDHQNGRLVPLLQASKKILSNGNVNNKALRLGSLNDTKDMESSKGALSFNY